MKITRWLYAILAGVMLTIQMVSAAPRSPLPPWPEMALTRERFDQPYSMATNAIDSKIWAESWSGYALNRQSRKVEAWLMPMVGTEKWNIAPATGTIRFWFKPGWSSRSALGGGPGCLGRLLEMANMNSRKPVTRWVLYVTSDGNTVCLGGETASGMADILSAPVSWSGDQWHLISLGYSSTGTVLCIDGACVAEGNGLLPPTLEASDYKLAIGSDPGGLNPSYGQIDELTTFQRELQAFEVAAYYTGTAPTAALGAFVSLEAEQARKLAVSSASTMLMAVSVPTPPGSGSGGTNTVLYDYVPPTNGLRMLIQTSTVTNGIEVTVLCESNAVFDLFFATNLLGECITNSDWMWMKAVTNTQVVAVTNPSSPQGFFVLGTPLDSDGDGLSDAYEILASKTDPQIYSVVDTDADGMLDAWEIRHGLNPLIDDSQQDSNGNGIPDAVEIMCGYNPAVTNSIGQVQTAGYSVFVASPRREKVLP